MWFELGKDSRVVHLYDEQARLGYQEEYKTGSANRAVG